MKLFTRLMLALMLATCLSTTFGVVLYFLRSGDNTVMLAYSLLVVSSFFLVPAIVQRMLGNLVINALELVSAVVGSQTLQKLLPIMKLGAVKQERETDEL